MKMKNNYFVNLDHIVLCYTNWATNSHALYMLNHLKILFKLTFTIELDRNERTRKLQVSHSTCYFFTS